MASVRGGRHTKEARERGYFEALAPLIGWDVVAGSIQQPRPPQPDILCEVVGQGWIAVELVALDNPITRVRLNNMFGTRPAWDGAMERRAPADQLMLQADLRDAYISVRFAEEAGTRVRAAALVALQTFLLARPGFVGDVDAEALGLPQGFESARIFRGGAGDNGPHLSSPSAGYLCGPQVEKIVEKLRDKSYKPAAPSELFAYATHDEPDGAVGWREAIEAAITEHQPASIFRRVHVFHAGFLRHICSLP